MKDRSREKERKKSKDKFFHEKSQIAHGKELSVPKNKAIPKENIHPNTNTTHLQPNPKPRRQRVNSRPSKIDPAIENSINYGRHSIVNNSSNLICSKSIDRHLHKPSTSKDK